jgi:SAM-dependent methyltransferase
MTFQNLLQKANATAYPEPDSQLHSDIIPKVIAEFEKHCAAPAKILDIGCGFCFGAKALRDAGYGVTPISVLQEEVDEARSFGFPAMKCEMHSTELLGKFDAVWLRHAAEHSPCPMLLLSNVADQSSWLYMEVPLPETDAKHETNPNHYSCLSPLGWANILRQSGWNIVETKTIDLNLACGADQYIYFICNKTIEQAA